MIKSLEVSFVRPTSAAGFCGTDLPHSKKTHFVSAHETQENESLSVNRRMDPVSKGSQSWEGAGKDGF